MKIPFFLLFLAVATPIFGAQQKIVDENSWTLLYRKVFSAQEQEEHAGHKVISMESESMMHFTQLLFSWNAMRPRKGYFSFWVQSRDSHTRQWSNWFKMIEWGSETQRSFMQVQERGPGYHHVRLEAGAGKQADAFRLKMIAHGGASLAYLKAFFVTLSDFDKFTPEGSNTDGVDLPSVHVADVPQKAQLAVDHPRNTGLCSPTSCSMLVSYLTKNEIDVVEFAEKSFDAGLNAYGSWPFNMAHAYERCKGKMFFATARMPSFKSLHRRLQMGIPVVVSVRGELKGASKVYDKGHLLVVVGWDEKQQKVICHDPACANERDTLKHYALENFLQAWDRSHRLAYIADPAEQA